VREVETLKFAGRCATFAIDGGAVSQDRPQHNANDPHLASSIHCRL